jgi:hypothetical protein
MLPRSFLALYGKLHRVGCLTHVGREGAFDDLEGATYTPNGHFAPAAYAVQEALSDKALRKWWERARAHASEFCFFDEAIPTWMDSVGVPEYRTRAESMHEYLYEFVSWLLGEIIASDKIASTYFRQQLAWYHAGHLPCGWEGAWPEGQMRVY